MCLVVAFKQLNTTTITGAAWRTKCLCHWQILEFAGCPRHGGSGEDRVRSGE
jgi:hypothetical protein